MFESSQLALFMLATLTLNLTPGPDMLYTATRSLGQGRRAGIASAFGIGTGTIAHIIAATFGLSAILSYSAFAFMAVKYLGAGYLIYLGIKTFRAKAKIHLGKNVAKDSTSRIFWQGVVTNILNPKVALFFLSFLPQFVDPERGSVALQLATLGVLFDISGVSVLLVIAVAVGHASGWLENRPTFWRVQKWFTGSVFIALGARLALADRK
ncbi:MAG: LysE family translocator [candidate division Zixibacteria bacterium]|nr:LysE family translocator [candidate division Zixibacteria bacterium]